MFKVTNPSLDTSGAVEQLSPDLGRYRAGAAELLRDFIEKKELSAEQAKIVARLERFFSELEAKGVRATVYLNYDTPFECGRTVGLTDPADPERSVTLKQADGAFYTGAMEAGRDLWEALERLAEAVSGQELFNSRLAPCGISAPVFAPQTA